MMRRCTSILLLIGPLLHAECQLAYAQESASFPIIDQAVQKARDIDRRHILETELQAERQKLAEAQTAPGTALTQQRAADLHRHLENIASLQRELASVSGKQQSLREPLRIVVKARRPSPATARSGSGTATFWNPYNRVPAPEVAADLSTVPRRESP